MDEALYIYSYIFHTIWQTIYTSSFSLWQKHLQLAELMLVSSN